LSKHSRGFAQFFVTWLIQATGSPIAPVLYVMFGAAMGLLATSFLAGRKLCWP
jgi:MHS family proline/betaine transporter-like MFS transporter